MTFFGQFNGALFFVNNKVAGCATLTAVDGFALLQLGYQQVNRAVHFRAVFRRARDNQWCTGFIDQNGVHLVDDGEVQVTLHFVFDRERHIVTQVIKTEFVVGTVNDVSGVGFTLLDIVHARYHDTDGKTQKLI